jgi:hypothetical protein
MTTNTQYGIAYDGSTTTDRDDVRPDATGHRTLFSIGDDGRIGRHVYGTGGAEMEAKPMSVDHADGNTTWTLEDGTIIVASGSTVTVARPIDMSDDDIRALRTEAAAAGDYEQADLCDRALSGDNEARTECARVIREAAAQDDSDEPAMYTYASTRAHTAAAGANGPTMMTSKSRPPTMRRLSIRCVRSWNHVRPTAT